MKIYNKRENYSSKLAFIIACIIHLLAYIVFSILYLDYDSVSSDEYIFIDSKTFQKPKSIKHLSVKKPPQFSLSKTKKKNNISIKKNYYKQTYVKVDSNLLNQLDSLVQNDSLSDSSKTFEEFILENPNLITLKIALKDNIEKGVVKKTKEKIIEERIRKAMSDYYKAKYPTPPYKFGERGTGNLINIPIEDVIELFK